MTALRRLGCLLVAMWVLGYPADGLSRAETGWVEDVIDGDSIVLRDGRQVRYIGIDAPEMSDARSGLPQPFAEAAKRYNEKLVLHRRIRLVFDRERTDRYDRLLAYVYTAEGTFVNDRLVSRGLALALYRAPNIRWFPGLLATQQKAMAHAAGLWSLPGLHTTSAEGWMGNAASRVLHRTDCGWGRRMRSENRVVFHRLWDAFWEGYAPCRRCRPMANAMERDKQ